MTATAIDPKAFYEGLVEAKLIIPGGVDGVFGRSAMFERVFAGLDHAILALTKSDDAEAILFPPVMDRTIIEKVDYMDSFPHLVGTVHSFLGKERQALEVSSKIRKGEPWGDLMGMTLVSMKPAACYPAYPMMKGTLPENGRLITLNDWVFRHEPSLEPTRMQAFRVREYIRAGTPDMCVAWRDQWHERGLKLLQDLGLPATSDVAADPFFGRGGKVLADGQKAQKLKFEVLVPVISNESPTACCSFNYHQEHFGHVFDIKTADGNVAHTACLGFGMERCVMALFQTHGFDPSSWPAAVRSMLSLS
jgi:seryl-tRNA synthetase